MSTARLDPHLVLPPCPPNFLPRPRLLAALDGAPPGALTLVAAGPGAGKTVLLADWARSSTESVAWLALTSSDNEPRRFWQLFLAALRTAGVAAPDDVPGPGPASTMELLDSLFGRVPDSGNPTVLVLDDAHVLRHPDILDGLDRIVRGWQPLLRLVIAARSDPLLPLHRYRLSAQLHEVRGADLAMSPLEARDLLALHGVSLPDDTFDLLIGRTEGWTAGMRLSALRMRGSERPDEFVSVLAMDEGSIGEYLIEEVLDRQPADVRRLLIDTSFLPILTGPLARAVSGVDDAADLLVDLARSNSFVVPLDRDYTRFRSHQLMAETLRYLLRRQSAERMSKLYRRAGRWFERHGEPTEALRWFVQAEDEAAAASVFLHGGLASAHLRGDDIVATGVREFARRTDARGGSPAPDVAAMRFLMSLDPSDPHRALTRLVDWRTGLQLTGAQPDLLLAASLAEIRVARRAGAWPAAATAAARALENGVYRDRVQAMPGLRAALILDLASARFWQGSTDDVITLLDGALAEAVEHGAMFIQIEILGMLALCHTYLSRPQHAAAAARRAHELIHSSGNVTTPVTLDLAAVLQAYVAADFDAMLPVLRRIAVTGALDADAGVAGLFALAEAAAFAGCGQLSEARNVLKGTAALRDGAIGLTAVLRDAALADMEISLGRPNGALRLLDGYAATPLRDHVAVHRARAFLAMGDHRAARQCTRTVLTASNSGVVRVTVVEALLCDAHICEQQADEGRSVELLVRAIELANGDIVLPFARLTDVFAATLDRHPLVAAQWPQPPRSGSVVAPSISAGAELPDPLTERERAVLRYLATSMSTAEIAAELFLSVNTVKTHLAAIYRKLAARRRREAVLRARELELL